MIEGIDFTLPYFAFVEKVFFVVFELVHLEMAATLSKA